MAASGSWPKFQKIVFWSVIFSYSTQQQTTWWHATKSGFHTTVTDNQLSGWTKKKLQGTSQSQTCTKKGWRSLFGGLLPVWSTTAFWIRENHYLWEVCSASWWDALKTAMPAASISQEQGPSSPGQHPTARHATNTSKVEGTGLRSSASPSTLTWPLANYHFFKHLYNLVQGIHVHNQQEAENAFQEFVKSWGSDFYATGISKLISHWQKCVECNGSYFDK